MMLKIAVCLAFLCLVATDARPSKNEISRGELMSRALEILLRQAESDSDPFSWTWLEESCPGCDEFDTPENEEPEPATPIDVLKEDLDSLSTRLGDLLFLRGLTLAILSDKKDGGDERKRQTMNGLKAILRQSDASSGDDSGSDGSGSGNSVNEIVTLVNQRFDAMLESVDGSITAAKEAKANLLSAPPSGDSGSGSGESSGSSSGGSSGSSSGGSSGSTSGDGSAASKRQTGKGRLEDLKRQMIARLLKTK